MTESGAAVGVRSLHEHWCAVLGVDAASPEQNFFDLGGDSMAAMRLIAKVHADTGWQLPLDILFADGTLSAIEAEVPG